MSTARSHSVYWAIFLILCVAASVFGYWLVLLCPAFKYSLNTICSERWKYRLSALDCCSWRTWTASSILALSLVLIALVLAMEPKRSCRTEVVGLYKSAHSERTDIVIRDSEIGYCLWYLISLAILNVLIVGICVCLRNEEQTKLSHQHSFYRVEREHKPLTRRSKDSYRCDHCKDIGYIRGRCCCSKKQCCPVCTSWEELDAFN